MESMEPLMDDEFPQLAQNPNYKAKDSEENDFHSNIQSFINKQRVQQIGASKKPNRDVSRNKIDIL